MTITGLRFVVAGVVAAALLVPASSGAQTAPPRAASPQPAPAPPPSPEPPADPLAVWQVAPSYAPAPGQLPHAEPGWRPPASAAYPTPGTAWQPTQRSFAPPQKEARSPGAVLGGTALVLGGGLHIVGGLLLTGQGGSDFVIPELAAVAIIACVHCIGGGVVLIVWGTRERWVRGEPTAAPVVRVGATSASASWSF